MSVDVRPAGVPKLGLALLVIAAAQLMLVLDNTIMNVALPSIQRSLNLAPANLNWIITVYALAFGGVLLAGGRAGDMFGRRRVFRVGLIVFTAASLLGGFAPNGTVLIAARALQGVGAAIAAPTALSLLATTFPAGPARNKALGVYGAMGGLGSVIGLLLGGVLTEYLSWNWVLFINVPIAAAVLVGSSVLVEGDRVRRKMDMPGTVTVTIGIAALIYAINRLSVHGWGDSQAVGFLAGAIVLLAAFLVIQRRSSVAMVPGRVIGDRARSGAYIVMFLIGGGMFAMFYFLTLYMQVVKGFSAVQTGVAFLPFAVGIGLAAGGIGPKLLDKAPARTVVGIGLLIATGGMAWFSALAPDSSPWTALLPAQLVTGLGLGLAFVTITIVGVHGIASEDTGIAAGLVNTSQQIGGAIGLAALAAIATSVTTGLLAHSAPPVALTNGYIVGFLVGGALYLLALIVGALTLNVKVEAQH
jgi:EmrB/QacA subfamily drug resistance transporter